MKHVLLALFFFISASSIVAQTSAPDVIASGGDFYTTGTFSNSYTIGEMTEVETYSTAGFILTQGFQQPADLSIGIINAANNAPTLEIFPNPSNGIFFVEYTLENPADILIEVFDGLGQAISTETSSGNTGTQHHQIDLSSFSSGIYSVRLTITSQGNSESKTLRINLTR